MDKIKWNRATKSFAVQRSPMKSDYYRYDNESYGDDSYDNDSYNQALADFFGLESGFIGLNEVDMYKAYKSIQQGNLKSDATKSSVLMALQAAAEGANVHKLVERIENSTGNYWVSWLKSHGCQPMDIQSYRSEYKGNRVSINITELLKIDTPINMLSEDYPQQYGSDSYNNDSYNNDSY